MKVKVFTAIIIDDEEEAQNILERQLLRLGNIHILGKAFNVNQGFELVLEKKPELIFLDIQMPEKNGFELVKMIQKFDIKATIIFVTAHNEFAINAMKVAAFDYLLKPVVFNELKETIHRYSEQVQSDNNDEKIDKLLDLLNKSGKLCFNTRTGYIYVAEEDIVFCQADVNYSEIHFNKNRKEVITLNIGKLEEMLDTSIFFRISRSHLINTKYLVKADRKIKSCTLIKNDEEFNIPAPTKQIKLLENLLLGR